MLLYRVYSDYRCRISDVLTSLATQHVDMIIYVFVCVVELFDVAVTLVLACVAVFAYLLFVLPLTLLRRTLATRM